MRATGGYLFGGGGVSESRFNGGTTAMCTNGPPAHQNGPGCAAGKGSG
jgi:hypothetical protein